MADMHVLDGDGNVSWRVIMHFPVPAGNNSAGVGWHEALVNSGRAQTQLIVGIGPGRIEQSEKTAIEAGEIYEHLASVALEGGGGCTQQTQQASLRKMFVFEKGVVVARVQHELKYYGYVESEV